jgi:adenine-specific DNA-methyltransferase
MKARTTSLTIRNTQPAAPRVTDEVSVVTDNLRPGLPRDTADLGQSRLSNEVIVDRAQVRRRASVALTQRTETRRTKALSTLEGSTQAALGQFFTPERAATLIADLPRLPSSGKLRVLDPGAGSGSLSAAFAARLLLDGFKGELELVAVELDDGVASILQETLDDIELTLSGCGLSLTTTLVKGDFIGLLTDVFDPCAELQEPFDIVIMNPPYKKLASNSQYRVAIVARYAVECANLYAAFLALGTTCLTTSGQLVAITPRSFANGTYFGQFRRYLLERLALDRLHVFESRSTVFSDTGVLQENVVFSATSNGSRESVRLSVSTGHTDAAAERVVPYEDVVKPDDADRFIRIPAGATDDDTAQAMASAPLTLNELGLKASTGRVVDFRSKECLTTWSDGEVSPLIYTANIRGGLVEWPREINKAQGFKVLKPADAKLLLPVGHYVVVKRFSAKEERRRIVASVWLAEQSDRPVAFENHLNVFHDNNAGLDLAVAVGLSYWLNSSLVDNYFRTFSGHTQVNAGDLKSLRYPSLGQLRRLGNGRGPQLPDQQTIDEAVDAVLQVEALSA